MPQEFNCKDCGSPFTLTEEEIQFFQTKIDRKTGQTLALPKRCKDCRLKKKQRNMESGGREFSGNKRY